MKRLFLLLLLLTAGTTLAIPRTPGKGSGVVVGVEPGSLYVRAVYPKSPAYRAGVRPGLKIVAYDLGGGFQEIDFKSPGQAADAIESPARGVKIKTDSKRVFSFNSGEYPLTSSNIPVGFKTGKLTQLEGEQGRCNLGSRDGAIRGDLFVVLQGGKAIGRAELRRVGNEGGQVRVRAWGSERILPGAQLLLWKTSQNEYQRAARLDSPSREYAIVVNPVVLEHEKRVGKHELVEHGSTIDKVNKGRQYVDFQVQYGRGFSPSGYSGGAGHVGKGALIKYRVYYSGAKILSSRRKDKAGENGLKNLKKGNQITVWCKPDFCTNGGRQVYDAVLVVATPPGQR